MPDSRGPVDHGAAAGIPSRRPGRVLPHQVLLVRTVWGSVEGQTGGKMHIGVTIHATDLTIAVHEPRWRPRSGASSLYVPEHPHPGEPGDAAADRW